MSENEQIIQSFIAAWQRLDANELASYFDDAGCYHNIPAQPVTGRAAIQDFIAGFISTWMETHCEIISLVVKAIVLFVSVLTGQRQRQEMSIYPVAVCLI